METKDIKYDKSMSLNEVLDAVARGDRVLCPECDSELVVALDDETIAKLQVHGGVYCSNDQKHVSILVDTPRDAGFWEQFKK